MNTSEYISFAILNGFSVFAPKLSGTCHNEVELRNMILYNFYRRLMLFGIRLEEKMNTRYRQKTDHKLFIKVINFILILLFSVMAVVVGIQVGELWYKLDVNMIENIDPENFKNIINISLPIIETIYNSGKYSVSFSGEVKSLFTSIFDFDLDSPLTILNVQSPLFMSYYNRQKVPLAPLEAKVPTPSVTSAPEMALRPTDPAVDNGKPLNTSQPDNKAEPGIKVNPTDSGAGNKDSQGNQNTNNSEVIKDGQKAEGTGQPSKLEEGKTGNNNLQPISSIAYEVEDEDENDNSDTVALDKLVIKNFTKYKIDIAKLLKEPLNIKYYKKGPKVLIYHTHTSESYILKDADLGKKSVPSFNSNPKYSVVRVGEELARYLKKYGIETLHNGTVHDKKRDAAYGVSINTLQSYKKSYPSIKVYVDIHRDAVDDSKPKLRLTKKINGKNAAQIMFVVGTDGLLPHAEWKENLQFVLKLQQKLNEKYPGLARPVWIVGKRYNQQVSNQSVLIEVGGDGNLLSECLESTKYLAEALNEVMKEN